MHPSRENPGRIGLTQTETPPTVRRVVMNRIPNLALRVLLLLRSAVAGV